MVYQNFNLHPSLLQTPMTWINLAFLIEKEAKKDGGDPQALAKNLQNAADAYRASMQVTKEPGAILGVSATGALSLKVTGQETLGQMSQWDISRYLDEFENVVTSNPASRAAAQVIDPEKELDKGQRSDSGLSTDLTRQLFLEPYRADFWVDLAKQKVANGNVGLPGPDLESSHAAACKAVTILTTRLSSHSHSELHDEEESKKSSVDAGLLSDALVLKAGTIEDNNAETGKNFEFHDQTKTLQQAVMIAPWNSLARQALSS